jgi:DNA-binding transcriptional MerR regulator
MLIGELAERSGVAPKTIRYYETVGILPAPRRAGNGYREYTDDASDRLAFIRAAQACGFTLGEIRSIVALREHGVAPCEHVRELIDGHQRDIDRRIAELQALRRELGRLARRARTLDPKACRPAQVCHIIQPGARSR